MNRPKQDVVRIFGERASYYTTSAAHTDPQVLARVVELAAPQPDWLALDIAAGAGHTSFALAAHVRVVIGMDLTPEMLAEARHLQTARAIPNVAFAVADVHDLPFGSGAFHLVTCRRAAHHFSQIGQALTEMHRVLGRGGRLVIDDRSVPEDDFVDGCMNRLDRYHDASHVRQYRLSEWRRLLEGHGFTVEAVEGYVKHRPLTALTVGVSPGNVRKIHEVLGGLTPDQRTAMDLRVVDGDVHLNHWYVMLASTKA